LVGGGHKTGLDKEKKEGYGEGMISLLIFFIGYLAIVGIFLAIFDLVANYNHRKEWRKATDLWLKKS